MTWNEESFWRRVSDGRFDRMHSLVLHGVRVQPTCASSTAFSARRRSASAAANRSVASVAELHSGSMCFERNRRAKFCAFSVGPIANQAPRTGQGGCPSAATATVGCESGALIAAQGPPRVWIFVNTHSVGCRWSWRRILNGRSTRHFSSLSSAPFHEWKDVCRTVLSLAPTVQSKVASVVCGSKWEDLGVVQIHRFLYCFLWLFIGFAAVISWGCQRIVRLAIETRLVWRCGFATTLFSHNVDIDMQNQNLSLLVFRKLRKFPFHTFRCLLSAVDF